MTATATLEFDPEAPEAFVSDEVVEATARFTDATFGGIEELTNSIGNRTAIGTIDAQYQSQEQGAAIAGPAGKVNMSGDGRGKVGSNDNEAENDDSDLTDPQRQMKILADLMAEMSNTEFSMESVLDMLLHDRDIPGMEKPSVLRMQQLIQVLHFYALQQASMNPQNAQYWVRSEMIHRLYQQLTAAAKGPNPEAAFKALIKTETAAITELRQQMTQQGLANVPLSQLTAVVVARQLLPLQQVFQTQLTKLQEMLQQAAQNNTSMKYAQVLQIQIAQLQATLKTFQSPALKPLMDYARAINAQIAAQTGQQNPNAVNRNGQSGQAPQINFAALPKFVMTAATMQALVQTLKTSQVMLATQQEWAKGRTGIPNTPETRGLPQTLPPILRDFWQQQAAQRTIQAALRPEPAREVRDQVRQAVQDAVQTRANAAAPTVALQNALQNVSEAGRIADLNARMQQLRLVTQTDPAKLNSANINRPQTSLFTQPGVTIYSNAGKVTEGSAIKTASNTNGRLDGMFAANSSNRTAAPTTANTGSAVGRAETAVRMTQFVSPVQSSSSASPFAQTIAANGGSSILRSGSSGVTPPQSSSPRSSATPAGPQNRIVDPIASPISRKEGDKIPSSPTTGSQARQADPANPTIKPEDKTTKPSDPSVKPEDKISKPEGKIVKLEDKILNPESKAVRPEDRISNPEDKTAKPEDRKLDDKKSDPVKPEESAQRKAMEAEVARLKSQGIEAKITSAGIIIEGEKGLKNSKEVLEQERQQGRKDLDSTTCPVGGRASLKNPNKDKVVTSEERNPSVTTDSRRSSSETPAKPVQSVYRDAAITHAIAAAQEGKTTKLDNGSKINIGAVVKGICDVCTGCGSCGSVGPVKESFVGKTLDKLGKLLHFGGRETAPAMAPAVVFGGEMAAANASLQSAQAAFAKSQQGLLGRIFSKQK